MKQASNFRFDEIIINTINVLAKDLHTTKTNVIEEAIIQYAASLKTKRNVSIAIRRVTRRKRSRYYFRTVFNEIKITKILI